MFIYILEQRIQISSHVESGSLGVQTRKHAVEPNLKKEENKKDTMSLT